jgi:hypothetical protein
MYSCHHLYPSITVQIDWKVSVAFPPQTALFIAPRQKRQRRIPLMTRPRLDEADEDAVAAAPADEGAAAPADEGAAAART